MTDYANSAQSIPLQNRHALGVRGFHGNYYAPKIDFHSGVEIVAKNGYENLLQFTCT